MNKEGKIVLDKTSYEYYQELLEGIAERQHTPYPSSGNRLLEFPNFDPSVVSKVWNGNDRYGDVHITAYDGVDEALKAGHFVINVAGDIESKAHQEIPICPYDIDLAETLSKVADIIESVVDRGPDNPVTVHCAMGMERSGLAVAWWLKEWWGRSLDGAYGSIQLNRPIVMDRREWIPLTERGREW